MNFGYVCFAYSKNEWIAKMIAKITHSKWSHSFITVPRILNREMVMESAENGVNMVPFDVAYRNNSNQNYEVYKFKCNPIHIESSISKCMNTLETTYGFLEYPWFIWRAMNKLIGRDIKHQNNWSQQGTICSGLVRNYLSGAGYSHLFKEFGKSSTNAQDVYEIVLSNPDLFKLIEKKDG